jgi:hypothetical protein
VPHQVGGLPSQPVQHGGYVGHGLGHCEVAVLGGRRKTALLEGGHLVVSSELRYGIVEIVEVHARTAVNGQYERSFAGDPAVGEVDRRFNGEANQQAAVL